MRRRESHPSARLVLAALVVLAGVGPRTSSAPPRSVAEACVLVVDEEASSACRGPGCSVGPAAHDIAAPPASDPKVGRHAPLLSRATPPPDFFLTTPTDPDGGPSGPRPRLAIPRPQPARSSGRRAVVLRC